MIGPRPAQISIDGQIVAESDARISVLDRGLLYGDGVFEVLRTWSGRIVDLDAHLDRLYASAARLSLAAMARDELAAAVEHTVAEARRAGAAGEAGEHRIRIVLTRGPGSIGTRFAALGRGRAIVIVEPLPDQPREVALAIVDWPLARRAGPGHKTLAYLDHAIARELAAAAGADEAVRLGPDGDVVECATANLFVVSGGRVATPGTEAGALPGITRARVLACCAAASIPAAVERVTVAALRDADEVFVTSALRGVVPATRLDGEARRAGPITGALASAFRDEMHRR
jgi:branched-chain amino acid aminotransferase